MCRCICLFTAIQHMEDEVTDILFFVVVFISNTVQAVTGFAGTLLAMPVSIRLIGLNDARVILNGIAWFSSILITVQNFRYVNRRKLITMVSFMSAGMGAGILILNFFRSDSLLFIYGIAVVLTALRNLFFKQVKTLSPAVSAIILFLAGIFHGMFVSGGALLVVYAVCVLKDKKEFRATVAAVWIFLNSCMMITYVYSGIVTEFSLKMIVLSVIPLFLATWLGNRIQEKINQHFFLILANILLVVSGLSLIL